MNDDLNIALPQSEPPDEVMMERIKARLAASTTVAVKPLPSNAVLVTISLALFAVVSFALAAVTGFKAIPVLNGTEMALYYGIVALFAVLFARAVAERMVPGEKHIVPAFALWLASLSVLSVLLIAIFSDRSTAHFVASGVPCLRLGAVSALLSGLIGWRLLGRGYLVSPRETILLYSFFAGLVGIAVLALHCPIRNSLHFLVWHLGAMVLAGIAGLILGNFVDNADR